MALYPGTQFGVYEIAGEIGAGGMGVVYRATDTKLKRDVAIKVLPESLANDQERLARFQREAELLASLNHPNIAQIHGLEDADGAMALVMELVEGPTLEDRIKEGALEPDEALGIAMQIAEALEAAHSRNIVHRDLKPANVKLRPDGNVKVLDFGIAKALEPENLASGPQSPMMTTPATMAGVILGTAAYMSPEQAKGKVVDQRTDIWAFGCVLYEMLTGQLAFGAEDVPTTLARVIANDTNLDSLPAAVSPAARRTIELCLQKDPAKRVADIRDVKLALGGAFETEIAFTTADLPPVPAPVWRRTVPVGLATLVIGALVSGVAVWIAMFPDPQPVARFDYDLPEGHTLRNLGRPVLALSPDGRSFLYNTTSGFYLRPMDELGARLISGTEPPATSPVFSPNGQAVVYYDQGTRELRRIALNGGAPVKIADISNNLYGVSWTEDDTIFFGQPEGIYRVPASAGTPDLIIPTDDNMRAYGPRLLPDGDSLLFSVGPASDWDAAQIVVESLSTGERTMLIEGGYDARYLPTGHLVYAFSDGLFAVTFDLETLTVSNGAVPLVQGIMRASSVNTGAANYDISEDGSLIYFSGNLAGGGNRTLVWVDRQGRQEPINVPLRSYFAAQLSPDGTRVVVSDFSEEFDIWTLDLERNTRQRLTFDPESNRNPVWSADGERAAFTRELNGAQEIFWQAASGAGMPEPLTEGSPERMIPTDISEDGSTLFYMAQGQPSDIWMIPIDGPATEGMPIVASPADERSATLSPDGQWLAYQSDESGEYEIYVRPFPDVDADRWQVSTAGGVSPLWSRDGSELFYFAEDTGSAGNAIMAVPIDPGPAFVPGTPEFLFDGDYNRANVYGQFYDVSLDGEKFLMIVNAFDLGAAERPNVIVVQNWLEELKRLAPQPR